MHLIQCRLRPAELIRFARTQGLADKWDSDLGYAAHAMLQGLFGELAPRPFRLMSGSGGGHGHNAEQRLVHGRSQRLQLLGYCAHGAEDLRDHAGMFALPDAYQCLVMDSLASKPLPRRWPRGRQLGFEVLCCPIARRKDVEKDMFLWAVEDAHESATLHRLEVYQRWLSHQLGEAASVVSAELAAFRLIRMLRRNHPGEDKPRTGKGLQRPQALFSGVLEITDETAFEHVLSRGVGRHRAFGHGMLLLRPAS